MRYDYKIVDANTSVGFAKRALLYIALLCLIVALALIVLFILFERYLALLVPGGMLLVAAVIWVVMGKKVSFFSYHFKEDVLEVEGSSGKNVTLMLQKIEDNKNAEKSDFFDKSIMKLCFIDSKIVSKNGVNDNSKAPLYRVITLGSNRYLLALDEYADAFLGEGK